MSGMPVKNELISRIIFGNKQPEYSVQAAIENKISNAGGKKYEWKQNN